MMFPLFSFVLALWAFARYVNGDRTELCSSWSSLEQNLKNEELQLSCVKDQDCQSLNCSGTAHGYFVNARIHLYACENPPSIEFGVNIPHLNINHFLQRIYHNDSISLTKNLNLEFEVKRSSQKLVMAMYLHYVFNGTLPLLHLSPKIPLASHVEFPIDCESTNIIQHSTISTTERSSSTDSPHVPSIIVSKKNGPGHNCSIANGTCGLNEICMQISKKSLEGECICIPGFKRDGSGICVYDPSSQPTTESPDPHHNPSKKGASNVSLMLTAILVPITVIILLVGAVYAAIRFRVFQHLRRRLRVQVYEHVLLGEEEVEEDDDLQNPVA